MLEAEPWSPRLAGKRLSDVVFSGLLLLVLLPALLLIALAIKLDSRGPVFYRVRRVGYRGRAFAMLKFRKMHHGASGAPLTAAGDPRLTRVGRILTRTRLDELPQLWDVLRGQMSLVGPRPEDPGFVLLHHNAYGQILRVRPGITGITQLAFASESAILDDGDPLNDYVRRILPRKVELDLLYTARHSSRVDLAVIYWTVRSTLTGKDVAVNRANAKLTSREPRHERRRTAGLAVETA